MRIGQTTALVIVTLQALLVMTACQVGIGTTETPAPAEPTAESQPATATTLPEPVTSSSVTTEDRPALRELE
jgi:hypothetical protein